MMVFLRLLIGLFCMVLVVLLIMPTFQAEIYATVHQIGTPNDSHHLTDQQLTNDTEHDCKTCGFAKCSLCGIPDLADFLLLHNLDQSRLERSLESMTSFQVLILPWIPPG